MDVVGHLFNTGTQDELGALGPMEAVSNLFVLHHRRLVGLASLLVDDQSAAEDAVQEAFVGLYRRWRHLRDPDAAVSYLNRAVVNQAHDQLRRRRRTKAILAWMVARSEEIVSAEYEAVQRDEDDRLWQAVAGLPQRQRQVLVLRYYLNRTEAEIADTLQVSRGSVKRHASRGVAALAQQMEGGE